MAKPYEILGVSKSPVWEEIRTAYKKLCFAYHPDKHPGEEKYYNEKMAEINAAYEYYKTYIDEKPKPDKKSTSETPHEHRKSYQDYTEEEKRAAWERMQEEWKRKSQAAYRESGRKMRAKIAKNLEPISDVNKKFKKAIEKCDDYNGLYEVAKAYADQIDEMINAMYEYAEKSHRYGMPPDHKYHTDVRDENVDRDYPLEKVDSSQIQAAGYDEKNQLLYIQFYGGSVYVYYGVVKYIYDGFLKSASKGKYFGEYIKKAGYKHTRLK